jgi:uncharacterized membrane protein
MGQGLAFLGLAAVTAAAIGLSLRFGLPAAILGLVGGFAAPALIGGEDANLPLLALYLALVTGGLSWAGGQQKRTWLGVAALVGGLGWGALILQVETLGSGDILALGLYLTILGAIIPALAEYGSFARFVRLGGAALASIQLAALVATSLHDPLAWGLYLLLGAALAVFGWREGSFREANAIAAGIAIALLIIWDLPYAPLFALVAAGVAAIFAAVPLAHIMRGEDRRVDIGMVGAVPLGIALAAIWQFADPGGDSAQIQLALGLATLAILPLYAAYLVRNRAEMGAFALCTASGQLVIWFALLLVTPAWAAPLTMLPIFAGTAGIARVRSGKPIDALSWGALVLALMALALTPEFLSESRRLGGLASDASVLRALLRWSTLFAMAAALASVLAPAKARAPEPRLAAALAGGLLYAASAQIVPAPWLAPLAAALAIACHRALPRWPGASAALLGIAVL